MLKQEQAQLELKKFQVKNWRKTKEAEVKKLPSKLQEIGEVMLGRKLTLYSLFEENQDKTQQKVEQIIKTLDTISKKDRLTLFAVFFPKMAQHVEAMWQLLICKPYHVSWMRKIFRAPHNPEITLSSRYNILSSLIRTMESGDAGYDEDVCWLAAWSPYLGYGTDYAVAPLLASVIESKTEEGKKVFQILLDSARGEHETGTMGNHVITALLMANKPEGWEFIEKLLLAAQREEGLRQTILSSIGEAHPEAFRRMLKLILDHNLVRFSSVVNSVNTWFEWLWEADNYRSLTPVLTKLLELMESPKKRKEALKNGDGNAVYLALWTEALEDAVAAIPMAGKLLKDKIAERRFAAVSLLSQLGLDASIKSLVPALNDPDLRIADKALQVFMINSYLVKTHTAGVFDILEANYSRFPDEETPLEPILWKWCKFSPSKDRVLITMINNLGERSPKRLISYLPAMKRNTRYSFSTHLRQMKKFDAEDRKVFITLAGDTAADVRTTALEVLSKIKVTEEEAKALEEYLTRKASDLRKGVISILLAQDDKQTLSTAKRLLESSNSLQRRAGLEILQEMIAKKRQIEEAQSLAKKFKESSKKTADEENSTVEKILAKKREEVTLNNALGLMNPESKTKPPLPVKRDPYLNFTAAFNCLKSLDELIHTHREKQVTFETFGDAPPRTELLGVLSWGFPAVNRNTALEDDIVRLPLRELWEEWWNNRPAELRDEDGCELLRALMLPVDKGFGANEGSQWVRKINKEIFGGLKAEEWRYYEIMERIIQWLIRLYPPVKGADFLLDGIETMLTLIPPEKIFSTRSEKGLFLFGVDWRYDFTLLREFLEAIGLFKRYCPANWTSEQIGRYWHLLKWLDEPYFSESTMAEVEESLKKDGKKLKKPSRYRSSLEIIADAFGAGFATKDDVYDLLLGPRISENYGRSFHELNFLSHRKPAKEFKTYPWLEEMVNKCRERIFQVVVGRGDLATPACNPAIELRYTGGLDIFVSFLKVFGKDTFIRGWSYDSTSRSSVFSRVIRGTFPQKTDTQEKFTEIVRQAKIPENRLVEAGIFAPQWSSYIEKVIGWESYSSAVWWVHAHTKDVSWTVDEEIREAWSAEVNSFTPLSGKELLDGCVDVEWFRRIYAALGEKRWKKIEEGAKYASTGTGHSRSQLFAKAMTGKVTKDELKQRITDKRHQDSVRALGLLPLSEEREKDLLDRYLFLQEFIRTGKKFGSQRRESEKLAVRISMENLARTAGYADPIRLEWAMETLGIQDMEGGSLSVMADGVQVSLLIDELGNPVIEVKKDGQILKAIPAKLKKNPEITALRKRSTDLKRQFQRMRASLETAMCRGDAFRLDELSGLMKHPLLAPMLTRLIFIGKNCLGYPLENGKNLQDYDGKLQPIAEDELLRIAHPYDLLKSGLWNKWQSDCFQKQRIQPFKQIFRELYVFIEDERVDSEISRRYAGQQVQPRKATALLGKNGWVHHPEEGTRRTFHDEHITASLIVEEGFFTPLEVEGVTIEGVQFTDALDWKVISLDKVPPRLFSEVMRDLDLVVSVAHQGKVDPDASLSTVEMRRVLVDETAKLLKMANVRTKDNWVMVDGELASYRIHLGSAVVHKMPGGYLCLIPVHSQHRGRIFLPFADNDPKTAEMLSKVILLAYDKEIKDPTILEQIRN